MKEEGGFPQGIVYHLDIGPADSFAVSQSNGLEKGFLGSKSDRKAFGGTGLPLAAGDLSVGEDTAPKEITPPGHETLDPFDIDNIDARSNNHKNSQESRVRSSEK
jgi:hypothetical protein